MRSRCAELVSLSRVFHLRYESGCRMVSPEQAMLSSGRIKRLEKVVRLELKGSTGNPYVTNL